VPVDAAEWAVRYTDQHGHEHIGPVSDGSRECAEWAAATLRRVHLRSIRGARPVRRAQDGHWRTAAGRCWWLYWVGW